MQLILIKQDLRLIISENYSNHVLLMNIHVFLIAQIFPRTCLAPNPCYVRLFHTIFISKIDSFHFSYPRLFTSSKHTAVSVYRIRTF